MDVEAARTAAALLAAVGIWIGIAAMVGVNVVRGRQQAEAAERAEAAARNERREAREAARREADQRHVENMAAIDAQNRRLDTQSARRSPKPSPRSRSSSNARRRRGPRNDRLRPLRGRHGGLRHREPGRSPHPRRGLARISHITAVSLPRPDDPKPLGRSRRVGLRSVRIGGLLRCNISPWQRTPYPHAEPRCAQTLADRREPLSDLEYQVATLAARHAGLWTRRRASARRPSCNAPSSHGAFVRWSALTMNAPSSAAEDRREAREASAAPRCR